MRTPSKVNEFYLECTCADISTEEWEKRMSNTTKANGRQIERLIKRHYPDIYNALSLHLMNPYRNRCVKTEHYLIYVHSAIEYFFRYN